MGNSEIFRPRRRLFHLGTFLNRDWKILCANILYFFISFYPFLCLFFSFCSFVLECRKSDVTAVFEDRAAVSETFEKNPFISACVHGALIPLFTFFSFYLFSLSQKVRNFYRKIRKLIATHEVVQARQTKNIPKVRFPFLSSSATLPRFFHFNRLFFFCLSCNVLHIR